MCYKSKTIPAKISLPKAEEIKNEEGFYSFAKPDIRRSVHRGDVIEVQVIDENEQPIHHEINGAKYVVSGVTKVDMSDINPMYRLGLTKKKDIQVILSFKKEG